MTALRRSAFNNILRLSNGQVKKEPFYGYYTFRHFVQV